MSGQAGWIKVELSTGLMLLAEQWGAARNLRRDAAGGRRTSSAAVHRTRHIRGVAGEFAARLYHAEPIPPADDDWHDDVSRRGIDLPLAGYSVRCRAEAWHDLGLTAGDEGPFMLLLCHEAPVIWIVGEISTEAAWAVARPRYDGDNRNGSEWFTVSKDHLIPMPEQNGYTRRGESRRLVDPQTPFWHEECGRMHPIVEHRQCRAVAV